MVAKGLNIVHRTRFEVTNGRVGGRAGGMPAVKLETTGRKSGQRRTVMLTSPLQPDGGYQKRTDGDIPVVVCTPVG